MKKSRQLLIVIGLLCALIFCGASIVLSAQQVKVPYIISDGTYWTGIAITNDSGEDIEDMTIYFTKATGVSGYWFPSTPPKLALEDPIGPIIPRWINYSTNLGTISDYAILANTVAGFYAGDTSKSLPSNTGSVILGHTGDEEFTVTVYIGNATGFAFQTYSSTAP